MNIINSKPDFKAIADETVKTFNRVEPHHNPLSPPSKAYHTGYDQINWDHKDKKKKKKNNVSVVSDQ